MERENVLSTVSSLIEKDKEISNWISGALDGLEFSTESAGFIHRQGVGIWVECEQSDEKFRVEVRLIDLSPSHRKLDGFYLRLVVLANNEYISGTREGKRYVFENVPPGAFRIEHQPFSI